MGKKKQRNPAKVLERWVERDLTAEAVMGKLPPAHGVENVVARVRDVVLSGRHPILTGEPGIGKTAVAYELVRQSLRPGAPLFGTRVVQLSFRRRMAGLRKPDQMRPLTTELVEALVAHGGEVVPFFRDLHLAFDLDLEALLESLAMRLGGSILGEGLPHVIDAMLETTPDLEQHFVMIPIEEPSLGHTQRIVRACLDDGRAGPVTDEALHTALQLTHRFLGRLRQPRKTVELFGQIRSLVAAERSIDPADVIDRFTDVYRVPRLLVDPGIALDVPATKRALGERVLGQHEAVQAVVQTMSVIKAGLTDERRPFGAFLFVGPTGVGKTHLAQLLAETLFGSRDRMVRLNMADYPDDRHAATLFGNPDGYQLRERRGLITRRLVGHPFAVLLLDELEKASRDVHDRFLQLIDEGAFINGQSETISCRSLIIIATSNAGSDVYRGGGLGFSTSRSAAAVQAEIDDRLRQTFRVELLNRFDQVVHFRPLDPPEIRAIAQREIALLLERVGVTSRRLSVSVDPGLLDWLTAHGHDAVYGARFLRRTLERHVTTALAERIVSGDLPAGTHLELRLEGDRVVAITRSKRNGQARNGQSRNGRAGALPP